MEFRIKKCTLVIMKNRKRTAEVIEILNTEGIRELWENEKYKYLRKLEAETIKQAKMKEKRICRTNEKSPRY